MANDTIKIYNAETDPNAMVFASDKGIWNVSKALKDCEAGLHTQWTLNVKDALNANIGIATDPKKINKFKMMPKALESALLAVFVDGGLLLIDGHHRLRALDQLGVAEFNCWIIEEAHAHHYAIGIEF